MTTDICAIFRIWIFQLSISKMDEVLSEVHVHNKFDLIPNDNIAITRFEFYIPLLKETDPDDSVDDDLAEPLKKKTKLSQLRLDEDGDLILNRSRIFVSPHHNTDNTDDASEYGEEEKDLRDCLSKHTEDEEKPRKYDLNVITLRHSLATELDQVGEQVWLGSLLLCDYILDQGVTLQDKTVVDLGAGTGITSIVASLFAKCVYCTDVGVKVLDISKQNCDNQTLLAEYNPCCINVRELDWFKPIKASEETTPYGLKSEEVSEVCHAELIVAADVVYDDDITDAFIKTIMSLLSKPPSKVLLIALEKRLVFTLEDLDIASPGYDYFRRKLDDLESSLELTVRCCRVQQIRTNFPQYFQYKRSKELELWSVSTVFKETQNTATGIG